MITNKHKPPSINYKTHIFVIERGRKLNGIYIKKSIAINSYTSCNWKKIVQSMQFFNTFGELRPFFLNCTHLKNSNSAQS